MKKTLVLGASENPQRYAFLAINSLKNHGHEVEAIGLKPGMVNGTEIQTGKPELHDVDTVTLYVGPRNQPESYEYSPLLVLRSSPLLCVFTSKESRNFHSPKHKKGSPLCIVNYQLSITPPIPPPPVYTPAR